MNENEFAEFESRQYLSPTVSRDEQLSFIDTLRDTQARNTAQINADTYALGSQLPSNLGGLRGGEETFIARYQTPQTEQTVADLRTAAQQSALNQALTNLQNAYKKRYQDAMLAYQRRAATPSTTPKNPEDDPSNPDLLGTGDLPAEANLEGPAISSGLLEEGQTVVRSPSGGLGIYEVDQSGNVLNTTYTDPTYNKGAETRAQQSQAGQNLEAFFRWLNNLLMFKGTK